jgi:hypothetical protein
MYIKIKKIIRKLIFKIFFLLIITKEFLYIQLFLIFNLFDFIFILIITLKE